MKIKGVRKCAEKCGDYNGTGFVLLPNIFKLIWDFSHPPHLHLNSPAQLNITGRYDKRRDNQRYSGASETQSVH